jgi:glucose-6-phosphate-specific signal transduction histidine kinase
MIEQNHNVLDHVAELVLLASLGVLGYAMGVALAHLLRPKPALRVLSPEELERNRAEAEKRWREEQSEQRRLLAEEIAEQLRPKVETCTEDDDMLRVPRG